MTDEKMKELERMLRDSAPAGDDAAEDAARRLAQRADADGLVDIAYATVDTPLGSMLVASTDLGVVRVGLPRETFDDVLESMAERLSPRILELPGRVDDVRRELEEYFDGSRREFDLPLDLRLIRSSFRCRVLENMTDVPFGEAITYAEAAARAGNPRAQRAAGSALGANPIPVVIPCHRVVRTGGAVGNYGGGPEMKRYLLRHEGWLRE